MQSKGNGMQDHEQLGQATCWKRQTITGTLPGLLINENHHEQAGTSCQITVKTGQIKDLFALSLIPII